MSRRGLLSLCHQLQELQGEGEQVSAWLARSTLKAVLEMKQLSGIALLYQQVLVCVWNTVPLRMISEWAARSLRCRRWPLAFSTASVRPSTKTDIPTVSSSLIPSYRGDETRVCGRATYTATMYEPPTALPSGSPV